MQQSATAALVSRISGNSILRIDAHSAVSHFSFPPADQVLSVEDTSSLGTLSEELVDDSW